MASRVLDATSFYAGVPFSSQEQSFTTPLVFEEIKHIKKSHGAVETLIDLGRLHIIEPEKKFIDIILEKANQTGDLPSLSKEDVSVLALCIQIDGELVTDDYTVSNVGKHLDLKVIPIMTKGISKVLDSVYFCPACDKVLKKMSNCSICGSKLRKKSAERKPSSNPVHKKAIT
ncbi:putative PIN domain protein [Nitrosotalea devaniterrae]|uniref:Endoribonuclease Nob1 n=1 Tax=Nitrosotalea devaniterrae TaxID=1078905 RepID=A0A128A1E5_9ARCH|nr:putative PIN domain protein [Candidatus Nitrosotalea devanaterra]